MLNDQVAYIKKIFTGVGPYNFSFKVFNAEDVKLVLTDQLGKVSTLTAGQYEVTINGGFNGGVANITDAALPSSGTLEIQRVLPFSQDADWVNNDPFDMELLERAHDRLVMMMQQVRDITAQASAASSWRGNWVTGTWYTDRELVSGPDGDWYICLVAHVAGSFVADVAAGYWQNALPLSNFTSMYVEVLSYASAVVADRNAVAADRAVVSADKSTVAADKALVAADKATVAADRSTVAADKNTVASDKATVINDRLAVAADLAAVEAYYASLISPAKSFRNFIINGSFNIWQRGTSFTGNGYSADRWVAHSVGSTKSVIRNFYSLLSNPTKSRVKYGLRFVVTSVAGEGNYSVLQTRLLDLRKYSGKSFVLSFYASADAVKNIGIEFSYNYGTGGSPSASEFGIFTRMVQLNTSLSKYEVLVTLPYATGQLGTDENSFVALYFWLESGSIHASRASNIGQQSINFSIAQVQLEEGVVATPFEILPESLDLQLCQYFYEQGTGMVVGSTDTINPKINATFFKVKKRATPTVGVAPSTGTGATWATTQDRFYQLTNNSVSGATMNWYADAEL